jgi:hypothetical protein
MPFEPVGKLLRIPKQRTMIQKRLLDAAALLRDGGDPEVTFQHSILTQVPMPYVDLGRAVRTWEHRQGQASLRIQAGALFSAHGFWEEVGVPYGPKPRLMLLLLNAEALRTGSPEVAVGRSLTDFVKRLSLDPAGRNVGTIRDQLARLSAADFRIGYTDGVVATTIKATIIQDFELWVEKAREVWPMTVRFSDRYFDSLTKHAVPLDERAIAALSHSAMALDIYGWLAQRLHRIPKPHRQLVPWVALKEQFGFGYDAIRNFRRVFLVALRQVHVVYPAAKLDVSGKGLMLYTSPPPVAKTGVVVQLPVG